MKAKSVQIRNQVRNRDAVDTRKLVHFANAFHVFCPDTTCARMLVQ